MMRKAGLEDLKGIMEILKGTILEMNDDNNYQWDENYPQEKDFMKDIEKGDLYINEREDILLGFVCINKTEPVEYNGLNWSLKEEAMVVHRMAVNLSFRRNGVGTELMKFADELAIKNNIRYLKTDTYSTNTKMNALFVKCGYKKIGEMSFLGKEKPFNCYDKVCS